MSGTRVRQAWIVHGVALALWVALYLLLFWDSLFPAQKPMIDLAGLGAVLAGFALAGFACLTTLAMVFVGRRPAVPLAIHGLAFAAWGVGVYVEQTDRRAREGERAREAARRERERQPEGCLRVRAVTVHDGAPRRAEVTLVNECEVAVVVAGETLVGFDRSGGNDILTRRETARLMRGETATTKLAGDSLQGGDPKIPIGTWAWKLTVDVAAPRSTMLCFSTPGAPQASSCADIEALKVD